MKKLLWAVPAVLFLAAIGCGSGPGATPDPKAATQPALPFAGKEDPEQKEKAERKQHMAELKSKLAKVESEYDRATKDYEAAEEARMTANEELRRAFASPSFRVIGGEIVNQQKTRVEAKNAWQRAEANAKKCQEKIDRIQLEINTLEADIRRAEELLP